MLMKRAEGIVWQVPKGITKKKLRDVVCGFVDATTTSFGRATHYNTREEQQKAELAIHKAMMSLDRDLYALFLLLPGVLERAVQIGTKNLLGTSRLNGKGTHVFDGGMEREVLTHYVRLMPPQMMFKIFQAFQYGSDDFPKANNARTRKLVLRTVLNSPKLEWWSVKYRRKMRDALTHVWGQRKAGIVRAILGKSSKQWNDKERGIIHDCIRKHHQQKDVMVLECVYFVLGGKRAWRLPLLKLREAAKVDLKKGSRLPKEVLEGLRSTYHTRISKDEVLRIAVKAGTVTKKEKMLVQRQAKEAGVKVEMDPKGYDAVRLYLYGFEMGFDESIIKALDDKANESATDFPYRYDDIGILVDASNSMRGNKAQALRPMAATLALRDMLKYTANQSNEIYCGGRASADYLKEQVVFPEGDTDLASGLVRLLLMGVDTIFVLSDGYENRPAGRFYEVLSYARKIGNKTPVYHINPVFAGEADGVRELAPKLAITMPVNNPKTMGLSIIRGVLETDTERGINILVGKALPKLTQGQK